MATYRTFEELDIWQKARAFANEVHTHINQGLLSRDFGLRDQLNRSSGSIMDNIAEGFERGGTKEFIQFLSFSKGSAGEARSQIYRAFDRRYLDESSFSSLLNDALEISKGLSGFMTYLSKSSIKGSKFHESIEEYHVLSRNASQKDADHI